MSKFCPNCQQAQRYDPTKPKNSKASGFHQAHCWSCYLMKQRLVVTKYYQLQHLKEAQCTMCNQQTLRAHMYKRTQICYSCHRKAQLYAA